MLCSEAVGSSLYPLVTHDPNMLKKSRRNLVGKIKVVSLPEGKYKKFGRNSSYSTRLLYTIPLKNEQTEPLFKNKWVLKTPPAQTKTNIKALLSGVSFEFFLFPLNYLEDWSRAHKHWCAYPCHRHTTSWYFGAPAWQRSFWIRYLTNPRDSFFVK